MIFFALRTYARRKKSKTTPAGVNLTRHAARCGVRRYPPHTPTSSHDPYRPAPNLKLTPAFFFFFPSPPPPPPKKSKTTTSEENLTRHPPRCVLHRYPPHNTFRNKALSSPCRPLCHALPAGDRNHCFPPAE